MTKQVFKDLLKNKILILDGATGTELQKKGMPNGVCPEKWVTQNPNAIIDIQKAYVEAGSDIIYTCTFGGNPLKLKQYGLQDEVFSLNKKLAELSKKAAGDKALVAGDIAPTGHFIEPMGELKFEEVVNIYKEQIQGLLAGGVDLFVIETMMDLQEARAALIAVKESCDLPVMVSITINEDGRTLTGTDSISAIVTLESLGADVVGCNCSVGPSKLAEFIKEMSKVSSIPLLAKPNAGLPKLIDGKTVFSMKADEFGSYVETLAKSGANLIGGCCGTTPEYIREITSRINGLEIPVHNKRAIAISNLRKTVILDKDNPKISIGERINLIGNDNLQKSIIEGDFYSLIDLAEEQIEVGAEILNINVKIPGINERDTMVEAIKEISFSKAAPLIIDTSKSEVLEAALRIYPGKGLINTTSIRESNIDDYLMLAKKYGAVFIDVSHGNIRIQDDIEDREKVLGLIKRKVK